MVDGMVDGHNVWTSICMSGAVMCLSIATP